MPRIYDGANDPLDFCKEHFPTEEKAKAKYGAGEGPDWRGNCFAYDADHPGYDGSPMYTCMHRGCEKILTAKDD
jgi:hypothetical protein